MQPHNQLLSIKRSKWNKIKRRTRNIVIKYIMYVSINNIILLIHFIVVYDILCSLLSLSTLIHLWFHIYNAPYVNNFHTRIFYLGKAANQEWYCCILVQQDGEGSFFLCHVDLSLLNTETFRNNYYNIK